ncbi:MAG: Cof-type HAD-IIB family hydrolase [Clostridia bacterium]|nr:Cof-type HAD-IIB family hydrolase [Clostridia bacterium]
MGKFDGILICTDLDGTLFRNDKTVSSENAEAMEYFKKEGGYFTFVTGRMPFYVSDAVNAVKPNAPIGCNNGGGLYDCEKDEYVWYAPMEKDATELVKYIDEKFPDVGIQVGTLHNLFFCKENETMEYFRRVTGLENLVCHYTDVKDPIVKIVFGTDDGNVLSAVADALTKHPYAKYFDMVKTERRLFEILPKGAKKGVVIKKLCSHLGIDKSRTFAIGDYDNDASMLREAGIGIAVANASEAAKAAADHITVSNEENAIARVICDIEEGKFDI